LASGPMVLGGRPQPPKRDYRTGRRLWEMIVPRADSWGDQWACPVHHFQVGVAKARAGPRGAWLGKKNQRAKRAGVTGKGELFCFLATTSTGAPSKGFGGRARQKKKISGGGRKSPCHFSRGRLSKKTESVWQGPPQWWCSLAILPIGRDIFFCDRKSWIRPKGDRGLGLRLAQLV